MFPSPHGTYGCCAATATVLAIVVPLVGVVVVVIVVVVVVVVFVSFEFPRAFPLLLLLTSCVSPLLLWFFFSFASCIVVPTAIFDKEMERLCCKGHTAIQYCKRWGRQGSRDGDPQNRSSNTCSRQCRAQMGHIRWHIAKPTPQECPQKYNEQNSRGTNGDNDPAKLGD